MRDIDTDALSSVATTLGVGNPATATRAVIFDDDHLQQTFDVTRAVRRGRAPGVEGGGMFFARWSNVHAAAGELQENIDPYTVLPAAVGAAITLGQSYPPYPAPMDHDFDVWILGATVTMTSAVMNGAVLILGLPARAQALDMNTTNLGVARAAGNLILAGWTSDLAITTSIVLGLSDGKTFAPMAVRVPEGAEIAFASDASAAGTINCRALIGVYPRGLGQDAVGGY